MTRLLRLAAIAAVLGGIGQIAATAAEPESSKDPPAALAALAGNSFWHADRVLDLLSFLLVVFALAVFVRTVGERGRPWARASLTFLAVLGGLGIAAVLTQVSLRAVADAWSSAAPEGRLAHQAVYGAVNEIAATCSPGRSCVGDVVAMLGAGILADRTRRWIGVVLYVIAFCLVLGDPRATRDRRRLSAHSGRDRPVRRTDDRGWLRSVAPPNRDLGSNTRPGGWR